MKGYKWLGEQQISKLTWAMNRRIEQIIRGKVIVGLAILAFLASAVAADTFQPFEGDEEWVQLWADVDVDMFPLPKITPYEEHPDLRTCYLHGYSKAIMHHVSAMQNKGSLGSIITWAETDDCSKAFADGWYAAIEVLLCFFEQRIKDIRESACSVLTSQNEGDRPRTEHEIEE